MVSKRISLGEMLLCLLLLSVSISCIYGDLYLHVPRGSNNRLSGAGRERRVERLFDSQNNARGGYNVGSDGSMQYYQGSTMKIEWTNQHSCSDPNNNCELIIQYMCGPQVRDGIIEGNIPDFNNHCLKQDCDTDTRFGMHENITHYYKCKTRNRNENLFTADQQLRGRSAIYTRQNPAGTRRGLECPEERDYYPYWHNSPWKDVVILTSNLDRCGYYQRESQNVKERWECLVDKKYLELAALQRKTLPNNKEDCEKLGNVAKWTKIKSHGIPAPNCQQAPWSRDNHLGNGIGGQPNTYNWTIPYDAEGSCVLRMRYNISTNDFDGWKTDATKNGRNPTKVNVGEALGVSCHDGRERGYVFKNDPEVQVVQGDLGKKMKLRLAINTAQFARTFQDRSHRFYINKRPDYLKESSIYNINVRGKRGNIVQVYPAVEYDFAPNTLEVNQGEYVHFQWTGSNTNPNNNAGQGRAGTDRSNVVLLAPSVYGEKSSNKTYPNGKFGHLGRNYPEHMDHTYFLDQSIGDLKYLAFIDPAAGSRTKYCHLQGNIAELDKAPAYFDHGPRKVTTPGTYNYFCTRNNNFSNRSQKGKVIVKPVNNVADPSNDNPKDTSCANDSGELGEKEQQQQQQASMQTTEQNFDDILDNLPNADYKAVKKSASESNDKSPLDTLTENTVDKSQNVDKPSEERTWDQILAEKVGKDHNIFKSA